MLIHRSGNKDQSAKNSLGETGIGLRTYLEGMIEGGSQELGKGGYRHPCKKMNQWGFRCLCAQTAPGELLYHNDQCTILSQVRVALRGFKRAEHADYNAEVFSYKP